MELNYFDLIVGIIVLLLGLKGIINGFFKELFGLIGIVGGIFIASRVGGTVGATINNAIFHFESHAAVSFTGFLITLALFWLVMIAAGLIFKKMSNISGLGIVDKIFGFLFGSGKFFLIGSVIVYAIFNIKTVRENLEPAMENSFMYPLMVETGSIIMHLDPIEISDDLNETKKQLEITTAKMTDTVNEKSEILIGEVNEKIAESKSEQSGH